MFSSSVSAISNDAHTSSKSIWVICSVVPIFHLFSLDVPGPPCRDFNYCAYPQSPLSILSAVRSCPFLSLNSIDGCFLVFCSSSSIVDWYLRFPSWHTWQKVTLRHFCEVIPPEMLPYSFRWRSYDVPYPLLHTKSSIGSEMSAIPSSITIWMPLAAG